MIQGLPLLHRRSSPSTVLNSITVVQSNYHHRSVMEQIEVFYPTETECPPAKTQQKVIQIQFENICISLVAEPPLVRRANPTRARAPVMLDSITPNPINEYRLNPIAAHGMKISNLNLCYVTLYLVLRLGT